MDPLREEIEGRMPSVGTEQPAASYGLLVITAEYNEGKITLQEWMTLSRQWALQIIKQYGKGE
jgi:hypothetical protein